MTCATDMADANFCASDFSDKTHDPEQAKSQTKFLKVEKDKGKTKIKWLSDLDALKQLCRDKLRIAGNWQRTNNNGGFNFLKSDSVTISFYPGTKTLNVQGARHEAVHKTLLQFAEQENTPNDTTSTEDTESRVVNNPELVQEINEETNDSIRVDESIVISEEISRSSKPESPPANSNCCDCCKNEILSLKREIEELRMTINSNFRAETRIQKNNDASIKAIEALTSSQLDRSDSATHPLSSVSDQKKGKNKKQLRAEPRTAAANSTPRSTIPKAKNDRNQNGGNDAVESPSTVAVTGDSITKSIIGSKLAADRKVKSYSFPGPRSKILAITSSQFCEGSPSTSLYILAQIT